MSGGLSNMRNIGELLAAVTSVFPQSSGATTINGAAVDRLAHSDALSCVLHQVVGAIGGAPTSFTVQTVLQHAPDNGSGAPGAFANLVESVGGLPATTQQTGVATVANTEQSLNIDLSAANRWLRAVTTITFTGGTAPTALVAADIVLGGEQENPAV